MVNVLSLFIPGVIGIVAMQKVLHGSLYLLSKHSLTNSFMSNMHLFNNQPLLDCFPSKARTTLLAAILSLIFLLSSDINLKASTFHCVTSEIICGTDVTVPACATQGEVDQAYSDFLASTTASGGCDGVLTNDGPVDPPALCGGSVVVTWTYTSTCDPDLTCTLTFTVTGDDQFPAISPEASSLTVECDGSGNLTEMYDWLGNNGGASATDNCGDLTWSNDFTGMTQLCGATGFATVTFSVTDACGNTSYTTATFTMEDTTPPSIDVIAESGYSECQGSDPNQNTDYLVWLDNHGWSVASDLSEVTWTNNAETATWSGTCTQTIEVTFTAWDECNNTNQTTSTFTVDDTTPPSIDVFASNGESDCLTLNPDENPDYQAWLANNGGASASDICSDVTWSNNAAFASWSGSCPQSIEITFRAKDGCDLENQTTATFTINDTTAPAFTTSPAHGEAECQGSLPEFNSYFQDWLSGNAGAAAEDACGNGVFWSNNSGEVTFTGDACSQSIEITFTIADQCGNSTYQSATFTIYDTTEPYFEGALNELFIQGCEVNDAPPVATNVTELEAQTGNLQISDGCNGDESLSVTVDEVSEGSCWIVITRTYTVTDPCDNISQEINQTINIISPNVNFVCAEDVTVSACLSQSEIDDAYSAFIASTTASGGCNGNFTVDAPESAPDACGGSVQVTWSYTSSCEGDFTCTKTFTVDPDPEVTFSCGDDVTVPACSTQEEVDAAYAAFLASTSASGGCNGSLTNNAPLVAPAACGGSVDVTWTYSTSCTGDYTCTRTFAVTPRPDAVLSCGDDVTLPACASQEEIDDAYADFILSVTASGGCNGNLSNNAPETPPAICGGFVDVTWTYSGDCVDDQSCTRRFTVTGDHDGPVFSPSASNMTVECDGTGNEVDLNDWLNGHGGAAATDNCGSVTWSNNFSGLTAGCGSTSSATVTFAATDACGNTSYTTATFTIEDTTSPDFNAESTDQTVECDGSGNSAALIAWLNNHGGASASDACGAVTWSNNFTGLSDGCGATGSATVTFTATDECGNASYTTATFTISDTTNPNLTTSASDAVVECNGSGNTTELIAWLTNHGGAAANDGCSGVTWTNDYNGLSDGCGSTGSATVHFTASDACGNSITTTATFTIEDHAAPAGSAPSGTSGINSCKPTQAAAEAAFNASHAASTYSDACSAAVTATLTQTDVSGSDCGWMVTYTFKVSDACGNELTGQAYSNSGSDQSGGPATSSVTVSPASQQYSDRVTFTATITNGAVGCGCHAATSVAFFIGAQNMGSASFAPSGSNLVATLANVALLEGTAGQMSPGVKSVTGVISGINPHYTVNQPAAVNLTITKENATVTYNGGEYFSTASPSSCTGSTTLTSLVDDVNDSNRGDIQNARLTFYKDAIGGPVLGSANLPVTLVNPLIPYNGTSSETFNYTLNTTNCPLGGETFEVWMQAGNYYDGATTTPPGATLVTVAVPGNQFVTGGGHLVLTNSTGSYSGTAGSNMSFGFNIKWLNSGNNLDGKINIIYRKLVSGVWKTYQIKNDNKVKTMSIDLSDPNYRKAITTSAKCTLTDITNPASPVLIASNLTLSMDVWESTTVNNGSLDKISAALTGNGNLGLMFSSYGGGSGAVPQNISAGKIKVRSDLPPAYAVVGDTPEADMNSHWQQMDNAAIESESFHLYNRPNPFTDNTTIGFVLTQTENVSLRVYNSTGQLVSILHEGVLDAGAHEFKFDAEGKAAGLYIYRFSTDSRMESGRMILER
jgi:hypothetical protein